LLEVKNLSVDFGAVSILKNISFTVSDNQWLMIVGPNGAGKSTLVHAISQSTDYKGTVLWKGRDIAQMKPAEIARHAGVLSQKHDVSYSFTVEEVVRLGRYAYSKGIFSGIAEEDEEKIQRALEDTGLTEFKTQSVLTLSGGELQRTFLAQILAQDPELLILDEPSNHLDLVYQKQVFTLIQKWLKRPGRTVISVVHDLSLAKAFGTHALLMNKGELLNYGLIDTALDNANLNKAYSIDVEEWMQYMLRQWSPV